MKMLAKQRKVTWLPFFHKFFSGTHRQCPTSHPEYHAFYFTSIDLTNFWPNFLVVFFNNQNCITSQKSFHKSLSIKMEEEVKAFILQMFFFIPFFCLLFWSTKLRKYKNVFFYHFSYFLSFCLAHLALQNAKTEHIEMNITKPILGILVALKKNELIKMT